MCSEDLIKTISMQNIVIQTGQASKKTPMKAGGKACCPTFKCSRIGGMFVCLICKLILFLQFHAIIAMVTALMRAWSKKVNETFIFKISLFM